MKRVKDIAFLHLFFIFDDSKIHHIDISRSLNFWIFPDAVIGYSSMNRNVLRNFMVRNISPAK